MKNILANLLFIFLANFCYGQALSTYGFLAYTGTYTPLSGSFISSTGGSTWGSASYDDCFYNSIPIGFNFVYCGTTYTSLSASANCWVSLGENFVTTGPVESTYNADLSNGAGNNLQRPILSALWLDAISSGPNVRYSTTGPVGSRVFTIEWSNVGFYTGLGTTPRENVEIKLYETSNWIEFVYGFISSGSTTSGLLSIGITGGTGGYPTAGTQPYWSLNNTGSSPTPSMTTESRFLTGQPATNQVYRWFPACAGSPADITGVFTVCSGNTTTLADSSTGGTWSSSTSSIATISSTGVVTGVTSGTDSIFYTITSTGCRDTAIVTVNPTPAAISGIATVCPGLTTTFTSTTTGGTWSSSATSTATVSSTGVVSGVSSGTATISYTLGSCSTTKIVTVALSPAAITGSTTLCNGASETLTDGTIGGTWSSSTTGVATINSSSGVVTGVTNGFTNISYTLSDGCNTTFPLIVSTTPVGITGTATVCVGTSSTLNDATTGGTWTSGATTIATISSTGVVWGVTAGTATISYTLGTCTTTLIVTVQPLPSSITGTTTVCTGALTTLTDATIGGTWTSSTLTVGTIAGGIVSGVSAGTTTITYTLPTGCYITSIVTVNLTPTAIAGIGTVCLGQSTSLSDPTTGGTWSSSSIGIATVTASGIGSGTVWGVAAGTSVISYTLGSCSVTKIVTVNPLPAAISGTASVCYSSTTILSETTGGGTWSSGSTGVATVDGFGDVTGVSVGSSIISYTLPTGCYKTTTVTVNALPTSIIGADTVCVLATTTLSDGTIGGTWTSTGTATATVGSTTGVVTGVASGTTTLNYTLATGCFTSFDVTVNPIPATITGLSNICLTETTVSLSEITTGGSWTSSNIAIATINGSGVVFGAGAGTVTLTYALSPTGCYVTHPLTVHALPSAISGADTVCVGSTTGLTEITIGGTWSSSNVAIATVGAGTGVVGGVSAGTVIISYTNASGCYVTFPMTVHPLPNIITGTTSICATEGTITLNDATTGGIWTSSNTAIATIGSGSGIVTGVSSGTATISYTLHTGCSAIQPFTVNAIPAAIVGADTVCVGSTTVLTDATGTGTWSSSNSTVATINTSTGSLTGGSAGGAIISYTTASGCYQIFNETVYPLPTAIGGTFFTLCAGSSITLTDANIGGTWSSGNTAIATITPTTGIVSGAGAGVVTISYTLTTGCYVTSLVTVNPLPGIITGPSSVCIGTTINLSTTSIGGTWSSSNTAIATVGAGTGVVTGVSNGTLTITYMLPTGCLVTHIVTVNGLPSAITGPSQVCQGSLITLSETSLGGTWSSSNNTIATIGAFTAIVGGVSAGTVTISYTLGTGCAATYILTVNSLPAAITGIIDLCELGGITTLTDPTSGGTWSSNATTIATAGSTTGIITGVNPGTATISYTITSTGCATATIVNVHALPTTITGPSGLCEGTSITLNGLATGGTWTSSNTAIATVSTTTGIVSGTGGGTVTITYSSAPSCSITKTLTVLPQPAAAINPVGDTLLCPGGYVLLNANTGVGITYQWYVNGSPIAGAITSSYLATTTGLYTIFESNTYSCSITSPALNVMIDTPIAIISPLASTTFCSASTLTLNANIGVGLSYQWLLGGVPLIGATGASYTAALPGLYTLRVTNLAGCSAIDTVTLHTLISPIVTVSTVGLLTFCGTDSVVMTGNSGYIYQWDLGGVPITGATNISYTANTGGNYTLLETNSIGCTGTSTAIVINANSYPNTIITASGPTTFCSGSSVLLTVPFMLGYTYQWYNGGVPILGANSAGYTATTSGNYKVTVTNPATGCSATTVTSMPVVVIATPTILPLSPTSFCWGSSAVLAVDVSGATGVTYQWQAAGSNITGATNSTYHTFSGGNFTCIVSIPGSCVDTSIPIEIREYPLPNPVISWISPALMTQNYYTSYQWYNGTTIITSATNATYYPSANGSYKVAVTDTNGCQSVSDVYILTDFYGALQTQNITTQNEDIKIYPNPTNSSIYIVSPTTVTAIIYSIDGKKIVEQIEAKKIDMTNLTDGMYLMIIYNEVGIKIKTEKIIKVSE